MQKIEEAITNQEEKKNSRLREAESVYAKKYANTTSRLEKIKELIDRPSAIKTPGRYQKLHRKYEILNQEIKAIVAIQGVISDQIESQRLS